MNGKVNATLEGWCSRRREGGKRTVHIVPSWLQTQHAENERQTEGKANPPGQPLGSRHSFALVIRWVAGDPVNPTALKALNQWRGEGGYIRPRQV